MEARPGIGPRSLQTRPRTTCARLCHGGKTNAQHWSRCAGPTRRTTANGPQRSCAPSSKKTISRNDNMVSSDQNPTSPACCIVHYNYVSSLPEHLDSRLLQMGGEILPGRPIIKDCH